MTEKSTLFDSHNLVEHADSLADYLPLGIMFEGARIENTNLRNLINGLSGKLIRTENLLKQYIEEFMPDSTILFKK